MVIAVLSQAAAEARKGRHFRRAFSRNRTLQQMLNTVNAPERSPPSARAVRSRFAVNRCPTCEDRLTARRTMTSACSYLVFWDCELDPVSLLTLTTSSLWEPLHSSIAIAEQEQC